MHTCWRLRMTLLIWAQQFSTHFNTFTGYSECSKKEKKKVCSNCDWWNVRQYSLGHNHFKRLSGPQQSFSFKWMMGGEVVTLCTYTHSRLIRRHSHTSPVTCCATVIQCAASPSSTGIGGMPSDSPRVMKLCVTTTAPLSTSERARYIQSHFGKRAN